MPTSPGTSNARENTEWPVTGLAIISSTARTHRGRLLVRSSVKADLRRKNNSLLNLHHIERRSFFVVTVILGTNLPMTPTLTPRILILPVGPVFVLHISTEKSTQDHCCCFASSRSTYSFLAKASSSSFTLFTRSRICAVASFDDAESFFSSLLGEMLSTDATRSWRASILGVSEV